MIFLFIKYYFSRPVFGQLPQGERLKRIEKSPHYRSGQFHNLSPTPSLAAGHNMLELLWKMMFKRDAENKPQQPIYSIQTNLHQLPLDQDVIIWLGHSSYLMIYNGQRILVDPVLTDYASPIAGFTKAFKMTYEYRVEDIPSIDVLIITHDHFDHLDYKTVTSLRDRIDQVVCGLGVGAHLERWGFNTNQIHELDWYESLELKSGIHITATPARHFSGRTFKRNTSLFCSFVLSNGSTKIFLGGDSGYDTHFKQISANYGPFDWAILENGQYNEAWRYIHTLPEELPQVIQDLQAQKVMTVHHAKFALAYHSWKEPLETVAQLKLKNQYIIQPPIGQVVPLDSDNYQFKQWWS